MSAGLVTVFGGSGFVGRNVIRLLAKQGWRVRVAVRRPDLAGHLQPLGAVGQIHPLQANIRNRASVEHAVAGADAVINLVGILSESGRQSFGAVQAQGAKLVAEAAAKAGVKQFVQMSAIGADLDSISDYAASKAYGEQAVLAAFSSAVILRPSVIFGREDQFFNRFGALASVLPVLPVVGGETKFQPVYVADVAEAVMASLNGKARPGATYELGGPEVANMRKLLEYICAQTGRRRLLLPLPFWAARLKASVLQLLPNPVLTVDQVNLLENDNVVSATAISEGRTLAGLGITPTAYESVVPGYIYRFRKHGQFEKIST